MNNKGEGLTSGQIITIALLIFGFIIILAFYYQIGKDNYSSEEICKISVLTRATTSEIKQGAQQIIPLQCSTSKICLVASSKGECKQFVGEKEVTKIVLPTDKTQQRIAIEKEMAQAMYSCWNMMGQGKLDLFTKLGETEGANWGIKGSTCVICSRVAIGDDIVNEVLDSVDVKAYMEKNAVPGKDITYSSAMTDDNTNSYSSFKEGSISQYNPEKIEDKINLEYTSDKEIAFIFMQMKAQDISTVLNNQLNVAGATAGAAFLISPSASLQGMKLILNPQGAISALAAATIAVGYGAGTTYLNQMSAVGYCGKFVSNAENKNGCSILQAVPYSASNIKELCESIEGNI